MRMCWPRATLPDPIYLKPRWFIAGNYLNYSAVSTT